MDDDGFGKILVVEGRFVWGGRVNETGVYDESR
jgi:hypothetical protein